MLDIKITKTTHPKEKPQDESKLGFGKQFSDHMFLMDYTAGEGWHDARIVPYGPWEMDPATTVFHYAQEIFEGMKAYRTADGKIQLFRPDCNANRFNDSADRLGMPPIPPEDFVQAVKALVDVDRDWVPHSDGASLYIRPFMIGTNSVIGVKPATEFEFRIFCTPVGPYFKGGLKPIKLRVSEYDRAAPHGTGNIKAGLNYAMSLRPTMEAHRGGYAENLYLDSESRTYVEETGGANVLFVKEDGTLVVPKSHTDSILPSITRRSLVQVAKDLGMTVDERYVTWEEVAGGEFVECGLCGTAAVISPVGQIDNKVNGADQEVVFPAGCTEIGPVMKKLRETLTGIQDGALEDKHGWVCKIG